MDGQILPELLDYALVPSLSREICEKLCMIRPKTLGQAARIPGMTPAAIAILSVYLRRHGREVADTSAVGE
jgi:tRNA uridine 5-carboxymethylaminomethyl modification enzyme